MRLLCTLTALTLACASAGAQTYPTKSIRWVVPSTPGDGSDVTGRLIADKISRELGQAVVIDNKPGAGGVLGSDAVAKSAADGYTMIVGNAGSHGVNAGIYSKLPYDVVKDFVPVAMICTTPNVMVVSPNTKAKTVAEFIALAKANPGQVQLCLGRRGQLGPLVGRAVQKHDQHRHHPHSLQRFITSGGRFVGGRIAIDDWQFAPLVGTDQSRQDPGFGRHHGQAPPQPARCARLGRGLAGF